jgi:hypothetical protein
VVDKFNVTKQKSIVCCILDNMDTYQSGWAREISINLTDFMIHRFTLKSFDIFIGKNEDELLTASAHDGYSHAVIINAGTSFGLSDRIFKAIENICQQDFFIAGHILDRAGHAYYGNACFELHQQFYIINLADYKELAHPIVGNEEWVKYTQIAPNRSEEVLYNDPEVAVWIKPGTVEKTYDLKLHGWNILNEALKFNKTIIDLGEDIRNSKKYIYYEYDHVFTREVTSLYYNQFFCHNVFAPFNSDSLKKDLPFDGPVEQYVTVGIGLHWIKNLIQLGYTIDTKVIFTDINFNCLRFMKAMVEEWDGVDYVSFYQQYLSIQPNSSPFNPYDHTAAWNKEWFDFTASFDNWADTWQEIKSLNFDFILIDYTSTYNLDWIESGKNTLMNLSDLFNHVPFIFTQSLKYRIASENRLLDKLTNKDSNIKLLVTSRAASGFNNTDQMMYGSVIDFDRTDSNLLKTPYWHNADWRVICLITGKTKLLG